MTQSGPATRVQTGAAHEKVRELVLSSQARGVLVDVRAAEVINSPPHSVEILEDFVLALGSPLPIAFLPPLQWSDAHHAAAWALSREIDNRCRVFTTPDLALDWLRSETGSPARALGTQPVKRKTPANSLRLPRINHNKSVP
ncbi:hypothetical protein [Maricaulis sp.]|uniref:hypothetical protein n=1 Tax=Maricaulis sp. TaxID=1486257 RepID=UPI002622EFA8|nr:hypothetical protein [Maricaulis sp.]